MTASFFLSLLSPLKSMTAEHGKAILRVSLTHLKSKEEMLIAGLFTGTVSCQSL